MKKLMIAAAIVCAAAVSQAASITWSATNFKAGYTITEGTTSTGIAEGITAYLFDANTVSQQALFNAFQGENFDITKMSYKGTSTTGAGKINTTTTDGFSVSTSYSVYAAVLVKDGEKDYLYLSSVLTKTTGDNADVATTFSLGSQNSPTSSTSKTFSGSPALTEFDGQGHWYATVPEPTSGLLLLLGVAGLALKRRRA